MDWKLKWWCKLFEPRRNQELRTVGGYALGTRSQFRAGRRRDHFGPQRPAAWGISTGADGALILRILDDGRGFDVDEGLRRSDQWGLKSMQERAARIEAGYRITSTAGSVTKVEVRVPMSLRLFR